MLLAAVVIILSMLGINLSVRKFCAVSCHQIWICGRGSDTVTYLALTTLHKAVCGGS